MACSYSASDTLILSCPSFQFRKGRARLAPNVPIGFCNRLRNWSLLEHRLLPDLYPRQYADVAVAFGGAGDYAKAARLLGWNPEVPSVFEELSRGSYA